MRIVVFVTALAFSLCKPLSCHSYEHVCVCARVEGHPICATNFPIARDPAVVCAEIGEKND
jgi:hypothetical protein